MGTTAEKLQAALDSKDAIKTAIENKGVDVGNAPLSEYADKIKLIKDNSIESTYTGNVDETGLTAIGWTTEDIQMLKDNIWWNAEDDNLWKVEEETKTLAATASNLTYANRNLFKNVKFCPKLNFTGVTGCQIGRAHV